MTEKKIINQMDAVKEAWRIFTDNFWFLAGVMLFSYLANMALQYAVSIPVMNMPQQGRPQFNGYYFIGIIASISFSMILHIGFTKIILKLIDKQEAFFSDIIAYYHLFFKYLYGNILFFLMLAGVGLVGMIGVAIFSAVSGGMQQAPGVAPSIGSALFVIGGGFFLIVPFVYFFIKYGFFSFIIVDRELGAIDSLKKSSSLAEGAKLEVLLFFLLIVAINIPFMALTMFFFFKSIPSMMMSPTGSAPFGSAMGISYYMKMLAIQLPSMLGWAISFIAYTVVYRMLDQQTNPEEYGLAGDTGEEAPQETSKEDDEPEPDASI